MTTQLSLFPDGLLNISNRLTDDKFTDCEIAPNPVDEVFTTSARFRDRRNVMDLLRFIARFPMYSTFNGFLLYIQNSSATFVATARTWKQKFGRQPKFDARPLAILAPMAPILFLFDIQDTEGHPIPSTLLRPRATSKKLLGTIYRNTCVNCEVHGIAAYETTMDQGAVDTASRLTPALRKQYQNLNLRRDTTYLILIDQTQNLEKKYSVLAHELGHIFCGHLGIDRHAWWPERENLNIAGEALEADAAAYLVCERLGFPAISAGFLTDYRDKNQELPAISFNAVLQSVSYIEKMGKSRWKEPQRRRR